MSTLGKILTVLLVLAAITVSVLVTTEIVLREKWMTLYDAQVALFKKAVGQRDQAFSERDVTKTELTTQITKQLGVINEQANTISQNKAQIDTLTRDKENQEARLAELTEKYTDLDRQFKILMAERDQWRKERDDARLALDTLTKMHTELENRFRASQADVANLKELFKQTAEEKEAIGAKLAWVQQNNPEVRIPEPVPPIPSEKIEGLITRVDNVEKVAEINLGSDDGVVKGMKFFIYNSQEMKYLATMTVTMVSKNGAAGELTTIRGQVKVDDHVTNRFDN